MVGDRDEQIRQYNQYEAEKHLPKHTDLNNEDVEKLWSSGEGMIKNPIKKPKQARQKRDE